MKPSCQLRIFFNKTPKLLLNLSCAILGLNINFQLQNILNQVWIEILAEVLKRKLRCIAGAKRVTDIDKPDEEQHWFWGVVEATGLLWQERLRWLATCHFFRDG
ncbi:hypothetical protein P8452_40960 [Trifolium repens]|nr:hypothetical protein P8452_40960 [Trifolium repens]